MDEILKCMANRMGHFPEGHTKTIIPYLTAIRCTQPTPFGPTMLTPSFLLIVQGSKAVQLGADVVTYTRGEFLVSLIDMPAASHVVTASKEQPYLSFRVDLSIKEIADVASEAGIQLTPRKSESAAFVGKTDLPILEMFSKMLPLLDEPKTAPFLSSLLKRELIFRLLKSASGHLFYQKVLFDKKADGLGKVIEWIKNNYTSPFTVEELAKKNHMSVSVLHQKFKAVTTMGPLQYQKQLRLQEARLLLLGGSRDVTTAAFEVGYESASQFSREYRRVFGVGPMQDIKAMRQSMRLKC